MMGDFVRGAIDPSLPRGIGHGIALHRAIDTYTDTHADDRLRAIPVRSRRIGAMPAS